MSKPDPTHSMAANRRRVKSEARLGSGDVAVKDASMLLLSLLHDKALRESGLAIAILAALISYGVTGETLVAADINRIAGDLGTSYDSVYKSLRRLSRIGYVQLSKAGHNLFLRAVWPQTKPKARKG